MSTIINRCHRHESSRILYAPVIALLICVLLAFPVYAQTSRGTVSRMVPDRSGAVIII
jgi:hypothetical protein